jgi:hypothetical protein
MEQPERTHIARETDRIHQATAADARRRALVAGCVGNLVEWYDFALYGAFATVLAAAFLPEADPVSALLGAFAVFGVAFVARPAGALLFARYGDRLGRRRVLAASILLMAMVTAAIGLLPGYHSIGWLAPVLLVLLRAGQGVAVGGEYGGSAASRVLAIRRKGAASHPPPGLGGDQRPPGADPQFAHCLGRCVPIGLRHGGGRPGHGRVDVEGNQDQPGREHGDQQPLHEPDQRALGLQEKQHQGGGREAQHPARERPPAVVSGERPGEDEHAGDGADEAGQGDPMWMAPVADSDDRSAGLSMRSVGNTAEPIAPAP